MEGFLQKNGFTMLLMVFFLGLGVWLGVGGLSDWMMMHNDDNLSLDNMTAEDIKEGVWVSGEVSAIWDWYCEETESSNSGSRKVNRWYLIPYGANWDAFIGLKVSARDIDTFDEILDNTWDVIESDDPTADFKYLQPISGKIVAVSGEVERHFYNYSEEALETTNRDEIDEIFAPFYIELKNETAVKTQMMLGGGSLVLGIILLVVIIFSYKKQRRLAALAEETAMRNRMAASEYGSGFRNDPFDDLRQGADFGATVYGSDPYESFGSDASKEEK